MGNGKSLRELKIAGNMSEIMHIACAADENYIPHCGAMLASLMAHSSGVLVHFLHSSSLDPILIDRLRCFVLAGGATFQSHQMADECLVGLPRLRNIPPLMWYRVFLPELLPDVDRILYVDADTLINGDVRELQAIEIDDYYVAAVDNVLDKEVAGWASELGLSDAAGYFNSGVLMLNLSAMRADNVSKKVLEVGRKSPVRLKWPDQDALNLVLGEKRLKLHPRWNCQSSLFYYSAAKKLFGESVVAEATRNPKIVHFEGSIKPWHRLSNHPYRRDYLFYRGRTPWPHARFEGDTLLNSILRLLPVSALIHLLKLVHRLKLVLRRFFV